jgi:HEAT repeat protein
MAAAADPNPVVRARAARLLRSSTMDIAVLRRLLRDPNAEVRLDAAAVLLQLAAGPGR